MSLYLSVMRLSWRVVHLLFGCVFPALSSAKVAFQEDREGLEEWVTYWVVFASFTLFLEVLLGPALMLERWVPLYYEMKMALIVWLTLPQYQGAYRIYGKLIRPYLETYEEEIDEGIRTARHRAASHLSGRVDHLVQQVWKQPAGGSGFLSADSGSPTPLLNSGHMILGETLLNMVAVKLGGGGSAAADKVDADGSKSSGNDNANSSVAAAAAGLGASVVLAAAGAVVHSMAASSVTEQPQPQQQQQQPVEGQPKSQDQDQPPTSTAPALTDQPSEKPVQPILSARQRLVADFTGLLRDGVCVSFRALVVRQQAVSTMARHGSVAAAAALATSHRARPLAPWQLVTMDLQAHETQLGFRAVRGQDDDASAEPAATTAAAVAATKTTTMPTAGLLSHIHLCSVVSVQIPTEHQTRVVLAIPFAHECSSVELEVADVEEAYTLCLGLQVVSAAARQQALGLFSRCDALIAPHDPCRSTQRAFQLWKEQQSTQNSR